MRKILFIFGMLLLLASCKTTLVTNFKVVTKEKSENYYTDEIIQTKDDTLVFCEKYRNGSEREYRLALKDVRVFEKLDTRVAVKKQVNKNTYGKF